PCRAHKRAGEGGLGKRADRSRAARSGQGNQKTLGKFPWSAPFERVDVVTTPSPQREPPFSRITSVAAVPRCITNIPILCAVQRFFRTPEEAPKLRRSLETRSLKSKTARRLSARIAEFRRRTVFAFSVLSVPLWFNCLLLVAAVPRCVSVVHF